MCAEEDGDEDDDSNSEMDNSEFAPVDAMSQDGCEQDEEDEEEDEEEYETMTMPDTEGANYDDKYDYKEEMDALEKLRGKNTCTMSNRYYFIKDSSDY